MTRRSTLNVTFQALSLLSAVACLLLIALWIRSYTTADRLHGRFIGRQSFVLASKEGRLTAVAFRWHGAPNWWNWKFVSYPLDELSFPFGSVRQYESALGFGWITNPLYMVMRSTQTMPDGTTIHVMGAATATLNGSGPMVPYWFLTLLSGTLALLLWLKYPWRIYYSLRTLLIATTLIAVALGMLVFATK